MDKQCSTRAPLSPAARALRLQRIFARLQEGMSMKDIAAEEGVSRERLRQIIHAAMARGGNPPDHRKMQFARLEPALRLATRGVAEGDAKAIPLLLQLVDRIDRYCAPNVFDDTPLLADLIPRPKPRPGRKGAARGAAGGAERPVVDAPETIVATDPGTMIRGDAAPEEKAASSADAWVAALRWG